MRMMVKIKSQTVVGQMMTFCRSYRLQIIWLILFFALQIGLFGLRIDQYLKNLSSSSLFSPLAMLAYAFAMIIQVNCAIFLLFPAFRRTLSYLRKNKFLAKIVPFDSWISFHMVAAYTVCFCAAMHVILILIYFYRVSLSPKIMQRNVTYARLLGESGLVGNNFLGFTAISGWVNLASLATIAFFALPPIRNSSCYDAFYWTHKLHYVFWASLIVHTPHFWRYLVFPFAVLLLEKIVKYVNVVRWSSTTRIIAVNLLPTKVTQLVIKRPASFTYNPGDYAFLRVPHMGVLSWHPFTISSCPEQTDVLWFHIKASGNWTKELRDYFEKRVSETFNVLTEPKNASTIDGIPHNGLFVQPMVPNYFHIPNLNIRVLVDGPYSSSSSGIFDTEHAVLVGLGIGVTPFASVLGSVLAQYRQLHGIQCPGCQDHCSPGAHGIPKMNINKRRLKLKKLDFIWVSRESENIQWFIDLLRDWENQQKSCSCNTLFMENQIYLTKKKQSVQTISGLVLGNEVSFTPEVQERDNNAISLCTAARSGRPDWKSVFSQIEKKKEGAVKVFYCGPPALQNHLRQLSAQYKFDFSWENF